MAERAAQRTGLYWFMKTNHRIQKSLKLKRVTNSRIRKHIVKNRGESEGYSISTNIMKGLVWA